MKKHLSVAIARYFALLALPATGFAQEAPPAPDTAANTLEKIEVTGSNIRRSDVETAAPIEIISRQQLQASGKMTVGDFLQTLTAAGQGSVPKTFGTGFAPGSSGISLRGLGAGSTLVLLNGRRVAPYGMADDGQKVFVDTSILPMDAVDRIEILKDGASALYGSDAIAGVVNIILRSEYDGRQVRATYGLSGEGDGQAWQSSLMMGFGDLAADRYNVFFNLQYGTSDKLMVKDRGGYLGTGDLRPWGFGAAGYNYAPGGRNSGTGGAPNSPVGAVRAPGANTWTFLPGCSTFSRLPQIDDGGCLWDGSQFLMFQPSEEQGLLYGRGTFALGDSLNAYAEVNYSKKSVDTQNGPSGVSGTWGYPGGPVNANAGPGATILGANHPDNPLGVDARLRYSAWDVGPRRGHVDTEFQRFLAGVKGSVGEWDIDSAYLHAQNDTDYARYGYLRYSHVMNALTKGDNPGGFWRIGVNSGLNSKALYDYISPTIRSKGESSLDLLDFKASRSLMELAGGPLGIAVGGEYRRQKNSLTPSTYTDQGDIIGLGYSAFDGTQKIAATYFEVNAPVLPGLELNAAGRLDKYIDGPRSFTPKFGAKWKALDMLTFRGSFARGFRAPNAAESAGYAAGFAVAQDPVRCPGGTPIPGANAGDCALNVLNNTSPNPSLKPERSKSVTLGTIVEPFEGTSLAIDLWEIKRNDEINTQTIEQAIALGHVIRGDDLIDGRPGTGTLLGVISSYVNSATTKVNGIDADFTQRLDTGFGRFTFNLVWSHLNRLQRTDGGTTAQWAGTHGNCDATNCLGSPKNRINASVSWSPNERLTLTGTARYRGSMRNISEADADDCTRLADGTAFNGCRISSFTNFILSANWKATEQLDVYGTIDNLFDRTAPLDPRTYGGMNYNPADFSGVMGRYFQVNARYRF
ncbi:TonB-dependent receptor [Dokdonella sp.]|uniref:TonB-dependent receptor n=1 Tax=Dokdonella sp. TaxID=2291710 RepID=UPI002606C356|nr:TonB-dependent receptor [Dokdonella sp.]